MISNISFVIFGLLLVTILQSAPVDIISSPTETSTSSIVTSTAAADEINDVKTKRNIDDYDPFGDYADEVGKNILHTKIKETPVQIHDNAAKSVDIDNSKVFSDIKMESNELMNSVRKRRNIHLSAPFNQRQKRALSTYNFYNTDPFYESLIERQQFVRPTRSFAPPYWNPSLYARNLRSALASSYYDPLEWNNIYGNTIENDDIDEDQIPFFINDDGDDDDEFEYNRYPILFEPSNIPYDNLQLQQEYNTDDLPIDEDDQDEGYFVTSYEPIENYLK